MVILKTVWDKGVGVEVLQVRSKQSSGAERRILTSAVVKRHFGRRSCSAIQGEDAFPQPFPKTTRSLLLPTAVKRA